MLEINGVTAFIANAQILNGVSLAARRGEATGVAGHNGAGKTTLMRAIMGLQPCRDGAILFDGERLDRMPARARAAMGIGYMPEDRRLVPELTARENIELPMAIAKRADAKNRLEWILDLMPVLRPLIDRRGNQLSGGQQKLVALARALSYGDKLLLLDEPCEGVAPALAMQLIDVLARLKATGLTILVTDSDGDRLRHLFDAAFTIERGAVRRDLALRSA